MKNKKKLILIGVIAVILVVASTVTLSLTLFKSSDNEIVSNPKREVNNNNFLTLMIEQEDGSYQESTSNTWPDGNYVFNKELSRCENGGELDWDRETNRVILYSNKSDGCYVYFDMYNSVQITNVTTSTTYNSVTLTVASQAGENEIETYYFTRNDRASWEQSSSNTYTYSGLSSNTEYNFRVYAVDTEGYPSNEYSLSATTNAYENPRVNSVTASNVTNNSITVSVNASGGTNSISRYYYSSNGGSSYTNTTSNSYTFSGLNAGQTYDIRVYVVDTNGIQSNVYNLSVQTDDTVLLADYIKGLYTSQGTNGLYYHNSSLANGAGDNSYRYAGANPNNYICFGSTASTCPDSNLYRIIGVFGDQVKLIMADYSTTSQTGTSGAYYNTYKGAGFSTSYYKGDQSASSIGVYNWNNSTSTNTWSESNLNTMNLNTTFLDTFSIANQNKIADATWYVNGYSTNSATPATWHDNESTGTPWTGKIGLMYVSDYGFAASNSAWTTNMDSYNSSSIKSNNWMYMGLYEWTISRHSSNTDYAYYVSLSGRVSNNGVYRNYAVRPSFYLTSSTTYASGSGTATDPIRLS